MTDDSTTEAEPRPEDTEHDQIASAPEALTGGDDESDGAEGSAIDDDDDDAGHDEADIAADYIEELLDICDLDGDIEIEERAGRVYLSVTDSGDSLRVLSKPDTVTALQELTRIAVQSETGEFSRLILDVGGSRDVRASELSSLVETAIERIEAGSPTASLPPMSSYERKLVHDLVSERGFHSESEGEGRDRHTVVTR